MHAPAPLSDLPAIRIFRLSHQFLYLLLQLGDHFSRALITYRCMLARVGLDFRSIYADSTDFLQMTQFDTQQQDLREHLLERFTVLQPKSADRIMIRMQIPSANITHRYIRVGRTLDLSRRKTLRRIAVNQQRQHHLGRILRTPATTLIYSKTLYFQR